MNREPKPGQKQNQPQVESVPPDDDLLMSLVESALACPPDEREAFARSACPDAETFSHVWKYVEREQKLGGFLLDPLFRPNFPEKPFEPEQLLEGRFRIVSEIARGGMGIVYEAFDEKLKKRIAIKCARAGFGRSLPPEVRHATEVSHPNVCKIYDIHTARTNRGEIDFITMEFLEGQTLTERLMREQPGYGQAPPADDSSAKTTVRSLIAPRPGKPNFSIVLENIKGVALPRPLATSIGRQLAAGLAAAHQVGLVHGDLKSNNVILTESDTAPGTVRAVITDFGLARRPGVTDPDGRSAQVGGAPDYMAPELLKGGKPSAASDVYALGVMLYELMAGRRPFPANLPRERRLKLLPAPARSPWDKVIARCLEPDPARRPANAEVVLEALTPKRGRLWQIAAAAVFVVGAGAIAWGYRIANAPEETVRLALLPVEARPDLTAEAGRIRDDIFARIRTLRGDRYTEFSVISLSAAADTRDEATGNATHSLSIELGGTKDNISLRAFLRDVITGTKVEHWEATYRESDLRYAPSALAGFVTASLHLPSAGVREVSPGARSDYEAALALFPQRSQIDRVLELLDHAVLADPDSPLILAALAEAQQVKSARGADAAWFERAKASLIKAETRDPDLAPVHLIAGLLALRSGKYDEAIGRYQRAIEIDPNNPESYRRLGGGYKSKGRMDLALLMLDRAVALGPDAYLARWERGALHLAMGEYHAAADDLAKTIKLAPQEPGPLADLAEAYLSLGRFSDAEPISRQAVERQRTGATLDILATVLLYQSRELEAIPYLIDAIRLRPQALYFAHLGVAYRRTLRETEALGAFRRGLQVAREELGRDYQDGTSRARVAYFSAQLGDTQTALDQVDQAIVFSPDRVAARFFAALTFEKMKRREDTLRILEDSGPQLLADLSRWPEVADLSRDSRFSKLVERQNRNPNSPRVEQKGFSAN